MSPALIKLHLSQLERVIIKSRGNTYADDRKKDYHSKVTKIFEHISSSDLSILNNSQLIQTKILVDYCFMSISFLDNSTLVNIPHQIVFCLEKALSEWDDTNKYIIVTSLQNNMLAFSFDTQLSLHEQYYDLIKALFNIEFDHRLIQINLPKYLSHDYLVNVVLYHELGHFVDLKNKITDRIANDLGLSPKQKSHYGEYFSDIFASQYIGKGSNIYLNYIAHKNVENDSHPSTDSRIVLVEKFLRSEPDPIIDKLKEATLLLTKKELKIRNEKIEDKDFKAFIPAVLNNEKELHSVFEVGWDLWIDEKAKFESDSINQYEKYFIINNLIEKSISNYMVIEKWEKHVSH